VRWVPAASVQQLRFLIGGLDEATEAVLCPGLIPAFMSGSTMQSYLLRTSIWSEPFRLTHPWLTQKKMNYRSQSPPQADRVPVRQGKESQDQASSTPLSNPPYPHPLLYPATHTLKAT
jgi:hypothetical protein